MSLDAASVVVLAAYATLALELSVLAVPSEASSRQIVAGRGSAQDQGELGAAKRRPILDKWIRYALPTVLGIGLFLLPLVAVFWPALLEALGPITGLDMSWLRSTGAGLVVLGRMTTLTGAMQLQRCIGESPRLRCDGVFRFTRNPILLGMFAFYLGNCCIFPNKTLWLGFLPYAVYMHRRVRLEESYLRAKLGQPYVAYLASVPRYLFF